MSSVLISLQVSEQVSILEEGLKLREDDLRLRQLICDLLQEVFKEAFPQVQVVPFGSTVTGLGWRGSDLDVCLLTDSPEMLSGGVAGASHVTEVANQEYSFIIDVLRRLTPGCVRVIPVLSAKCPLIRFTHQPSGLACDLTINNRYVAWRQAKLSLVCVRDVNIPYDDDDDNDDDDSYLFFDPTRLRPIVCLQNDTRVYSIPAEIV